MKLLGSFVLACAALTLGAGCWSVPTASSFIPAVPSISTPSIATPSISTPTLSTPTNLAPGLPRPPSVPGPPGMPQPPSPW